MAAAAIFAALLIYPLDAANAAKTALSLCAELIIPSLFPFFVAALTLSELGFADMLGRLLSPAAAKLFGVSGKGATAFFVGITGGYPLGAAYIADLRKSETIDRTEAERLLAFCSNSGPAFIIGAVGVGIFSSSSVGLFLYAIHIAAAIVGGIIFGGGHTEIENTVITRSVSFSSALTEAVRRSVTSLLFICGFVVAFSVFMELLKSFGPFSELSAKLSGAFGCELSWGKALLIGIFELGSGIGAMSGSTFSPENLALAAFLLGWGGFSVHFQTFSLLRDTDIKAARYMIGRLVIALIAAVAAYFGAYIFF